MDNEQSINIEIIQYDDNTLVVETCPLVLPGEFNDLVNAQVEGKYAALSGAIFTGNISAPNISTTGTLIANHANITTELYTNTLTADVLNFGAINNGGSLRISGSGVFESGLYVMGNGDKLYVQDSAYIGGTLNASSLNFGALNSSGNIIINGTGYFNSNISTRATALSTTPTQFAVFSGSPNITAKTLYTRTPSEVKADIGLGNVTNNAQMRKRPSSTDGYVPTWNGASGDYLNTGYSIETTLTGASTALPRADAVKNYIDSLLGNADALVFKGTLGSGGTITSLPSTYSAGWTYKIISSGTYAGNICENGDLIIAIIDRNGINNQNSDWTVVQNNTDGAVVNTRTLTAGSGLVGGGDLTANRTFDIGQGDGINVTADAIAVNSTVVRTSGNQNINGIKLFDGTFKAAGINDGANINYNVIFTPSQIGIGQGDIPVYLAGMAYYDNNGIYGPTKEIVNKEFLAGGYSPIGHTHTSSGITNFNSAVSGLLPITNLTAGSGIGITQSGTVFTVATTGTFGLTQAQVDARVTALTSGIYAPLNSPSFSGIPLVPTAGSGTNTQQIASTAFVRTEISNLINSAPSTLDTLNELATALGNDPNFATTITNSLAGKANLSGATFTGSVSGPSGNFTSLKVNNIDVSPSGHTHTSSNITDFNSSVSGLLPVKNIVGGTSISVSSVSGQYTISATGVAAASASSLTVTCQNITGSQIPKMSVVYINGGQGNLPTITLARANIEMTSSKTFGVTAQDINDNSSGTVVVLGALIDVDTNQFGTNLEGTTLYLSPTISGGMTITKPSAPNHMVSVGKIVRSHNIQGIIQVNIQNGFELEELHNVAISGVTNGQFLQYNTASGLWISSTSGNFSTLNVNNNPVYHSGILPNPVTGVGTSGYLTKWISSSGVSSGIIFDNGTSVGIGTTSPSSTNKLEIAGGDVLIGPADNTTKLIFFSSSYGIKCESGLEIFTGDRIRFRKGGVEYARIESDGKFGIGTSTPSGQLHVIGTGLFSGNVGIGSGSQAISPSERLVVDGNIRLADGTYRLQLFRGGGTAFDYSIGKEGNHLALSTANDATIQRAVQIGSHIAGVWTPRIHLNGWTGQVGIGTTVPQSGFILDANGAAVIRGSILTNSTIQEFGNLRYQIHSGASSNQVTYFCNGGGRFGVGFTAPSGLVAISGGVSIGSAYNTTPPTDGLIVQGNVGIGNTTPSGQLHVTGTGIFSSGLSVGATTTTVGATTYNSLFNGNICIGSGDAVRTISIFGNNSTKSMILKSQGGNSYVTYGVGSQNLGLGDSDIGGSAFLNINYYAGSSPGSGTGHKFYTKSPNFGGYYDVIINSSGWMGIGSGIIPQAELHVIGNGIFSNSITSSSGYLSYLNINNNTVGGSSALAVNGSITTQGQDITAGGLSIYGSTLNRLTLTGSTLRLSTNDITVPHTFVHFSGATPIERMRITGSGVGIGTTTPSGQLHVIGSGIFSSGIIVGNGTVANPSIVFDGSRTTGFSSTSDLLEVSVLGNRVMRMSQFGTVAINRGTGSALGTLHVQGNGSNPANTSDPMVITSSVGSGSIIRFTDSASNDWQVGVNPNGSITSGSGSGNFAITKIVSNSGIPYLTINTNGNVGIGTTSPSERLEVNGNIVCRDLYLESVSNASIISSGLTLDLKASQSFNVNLNSSITGINITNVPSISGVATGFSLIFTADGTPRSITWPSSIKWAGSTAPTLTSANGKTDIFSFVTINSGINWFGFIGGQNY